jgi:hypothetical protein
LKRRWKRIGFYLEALECLRLGMSFDYAVEVVGVDDDVASAIEVLFV